MADRLEVRPSLPLLIEAVAEKYGVQVEALSQRRRGGALSEAKRLICHVATRRFGYSGEAVGKALGITRSGVCRGAERGGEILKEDLTLQEEVEVLLTKSGCLVGKGPAITLDINS